ncbi:MAG: cytochrome c oxidase subunit 3 [Saprospiraceae bacterium]|nr:cytochrome c oxidase subunit 3 [Saprospiraceae bacterium]
MAETLSSEIVDQDKNLWSGGKPPMKVSYGKLMMWYFLLSDAFTFAGLLIGYGALRFSMPNWPVPEKVFNKFPFADAELPLIFVTFMTFVLLASSFTMMRAVQEGHEENRKGVIKWMILTILGGFTFLGCQAWEWTTLIAKEHASIHTNPFGRLTEDGIYLNADGSEGEAFEAGQSYLIHNIKSHEAAHGESHEGGHEASVGHTEPGDYPDAFIDQEGYIHRKFKVTSGADAGQIQSEPFGPKAFGGLFFFITGFHGFHVFSGVLFLTIILINVISGIYVARKNGYEMVEKIGLYWHFVDLVWVFVFLVYYLI